MPYSPPFAITTDILNLVAEISQQVGRLDASAFYASPQLRKQNRIKTITGTLAIEGNTLTEAQITAIIEGKRVLGSVRELAEVNGAIQAYEALTDLQPNELEFIHPFSDGNGRMGRLWQTLILSKWHPLFLSLPLENVIKDHQQQYYQALEQADQQADSTPFIHFMLEVIAQTLAQNAPVNVLVNAPVNTIVEVAGLKSTDAILALLAANPELTRQQLADTIGKDIRTIGRALTKLQQAGKVKRIGSDKNGYWEVQHVCGD